MVEKNSSFNFICIQHNIFLEIQILKKNWML